MERLLHYVWQHKMLPLTPLQTTDGQRVEVVDPGRLNHDAGPDFFNAKILIDGTLWVGNVELHERSSDWFAHGHQTDPAYDSIVLHVAEEVDADVVTLSGKHPPQLQLRVPKEIEDGYEELLSSAERHPCSTVVAQLPAITVRSWLAALQTERLEQKTETIARRAQACGGSWEDAAFVTLARNFGFGINGDAFEQWALHMPMASVAHHRDDEFQVETLFMGQAGLLREESMQERQREAAQKDDYFLGMQREYRYLSHKFQLEPVQPQQWRFLRLRPQNFPHVRLSQLARLYVSRRFSLSLLADCQSVDDIRRLLQTSATDYWRTHYTFGMESRPSDKRLTAASIDLLTINTALPLLFAYGRHKRDERLVERATDLLDSLRPENNTVVRSWQDCGLRPATASDSQALLQLTRQYCERRDCLRCRFGYEYMKAKRLSSPIKNVYLQKI